MIDQVCTLRGFVVNFKGDWKYLAQLFNMRKTAQQEEARAAKITGRPRYRLGAIYRPRVLSIDP